MAYVLEAFWVALFSIVILKTKTFRRWIGGIGLLAGVLQVFNALAFFSTLPSAATFPGNLALAAWFIGVRISLIRLKS